ncbi:hypothetical protein [Cryobacterium luteum]|uniref:Uncharacterized protein n=1 Tax=Cryobacterium luteum TaxID=1424661 RepID=A0A1H8HIA8_9MICO|nr:hypothetical protein [Cryobacterium luteum]TFB86660.1 hypothetical protein E3O10_13645 [Cryobacterium luteum]SEN55836.1 hypothetical protein SAMN05216281_109122 [Cryobacterium luteum]
MYGDMSAVRIDASYLRARAEAMRSRALQLTAQAEAMSWNSAAAQVFRTQITLTADDIGRTAATLDAAADALGTHARAVDDVKALIVQAQAWAAERLDEARSIASNAVKVIQDVAENAVTSFMTVVNSAVDVVTKTVQVSVYKLANIDIAESVVTHAQDVMRTIPSPPSTGSKDWLDVEYLLKTALRP